MVMTDAPLSIREQIMRQLLDRAKNYSLTATRDPIRRQDKQLPRLVLQELGESKDVPVFRKHNLVLTVSVSLADAIDPRSDSLSSVANAHIAGLLSALLNPDSSLGGLCDGLDYESSAIRYPEPGDIVLGISLIISVRYSIAFGNPYSH
jgi:hypothetical protein